MATTLSHRKKLTRERRVFIIAAAVGLAVVVSIILGYYAAETVTRREVVGSVVSFGVSSHQSMRGRYAVVRLEDDHTVRVGVPGHLTMKIGRRVQLIETTTALMGVTGKSYSFHAFVEDESEDSPVGGENGKGVLLR